MTCQHVFSKNEIPYFQDFSFLKGIPENVKFEISFCNILGTDKTRVKLTGRNYGELSNYGNGSILVLFDNLPVEVQEKLKGINND